MGTAAAIRAPWEPVVARADPPPDQHELVELVERARTDPDAFTSLYRAYVRRIHSFAYRRSGSYEVAEEITASTFERAWRGLPAFAWQGAGFEPWLFRIASNEIAGHFRRQARSRTDRAQRALREMADDLSEDQALVDMFRLDEAAERTDLVRRALATLRPRYEEAITLRHLSGLSPDEAAQAMGCSKPTLAVVLHRAVRSLRRAVDEIAKEEAK